MPCRLSPILGWTCAGFISYKLLCMAMYAYLNMRKTSDRFAASEMEMEVPPPHTVHIPYP